MANSVLHKSSSTAGVVPAAASLTSREIALNTADGRLFTKKDSGAVVEFAQTALIKAQYNITGGGIVAVDGSGNVSWSVRFIVISNGNGSHFSTNGCFDINLPTSGTITGVGGAANVTATAAGIPLKGDQALYYILPIGSNSTSVAANFRVATYTSALVVPDTWVLICIRNVDNGRFYFPNGYSLTLNQSINTGTYSTRYSYDSDLLDGQHGSYYAPIANPTFAGYAKATQGLASSTNVFPTYELNLDFGADAAGTWRKIVTASLGNEIYSTHGFVIEIIDPRTNHATSGSVNTVKREVYYVACVRAETTVLNTPDACYISSAGGDRIRAVKVSTGNYEIQVKLEDIYREYRVRIYTYATNGSHAITYNHGTTVGSTGTAQYVPASAGTDISTSTVDKFCNATITGTLGIGDFSTSGTRTKISSSGSGLVINHNDNSPTYFQNQGTNRLTLAADGTLTATNSVLFGASINKYTSSAFQYQFFLSDHVAFTKKTGSYNFYWRHNSTGDNGGASEQTPMQLTDAGNLTITGTLNAAGLTLPSQTAKTFLAAPTTANGVPTFRAIDPYDLPSAIYSRSSTSGSFVSCGIYYGTTWQHLGTNSYGWVLKNDGANGTRLYVASTAGTADSAATLATFTFSPSGSLAVPQYVYAGYFNMSGAADATAATEYFFGYGDGFIRRKTLANVKAEIVTSAAIVAGLGYTPSNPGGLTVSVISTNTTATAGATYCLTASLTLTLPATPAAGAMVTILNRRGVATCIVARNGSNIMALAQDLTLDLSASFSLVYTDATNGWVIL